MKRIHYKLSDGTVHECCICGDVELVDMVEVPEGGDGEKIRQGETVYGEDGETWHVVGFRMGTRSVVAIGLDGACRYMRPERLTHEEPDSWGRLFCDMRFSLTSCENGVYRFNDVTCEDMRRRATALVHRDERREEEE